MCDANVSHEGRCGRMPFLTVKPPHFDCPTSGSSRNLSDGGGVLKAAVELVHVSSSVRLVLRIVIPQPCSVVVQSVWWPFCFGNMCHRRGWSIRTSRQSKQCHSTTSKAGTTCFKIRFLESKYKRDNCMCNRTKRHSEH
jgi:hypothetical protein